MGRFSFGLPNRSNSLYIFQVCPQDLCDTPCLCDASTRVMRRIAFKDFRNVSKACLGKMLLQRLKPFCGLFTSTITITVRFNIGGDEWPYEPWPDRALMIGAVACRWTAGVTAAVIWIAGRKTAKSIWCE